MDMESTSSASLKIGKIISYNGLLLIIMTFLIILCVVNLVLFSHEDSKILNITNGTNVWGQAINNLTETLYHKLMPNLFNKFNISF